MLILGETYYPYNEWICDNTLQKVLLTSNSTKKEYKQDDFLYIEGFDNFEENGCVEYTAYKLHSKYHFTHVRG